MQWFLWQVRIPCPTVRFSVAVLTGRSYWGIKKITEGYWQLSLFYLYMSKLAVYQDYTCGSSSGRNYRAKDQVEVSHTNHTIAGGFDIYSDASSFISRISLFFRLSFSSSYIPITRRWAFILSLKIDRGSWCCPRYCSEERDQFWNEDIEDKPFWK